MSYAEGDRVAWSDNHRDQGTVIGVRGPNPQRSRGSGEWQARVRWDSGAIGWTSFPGLRHLDVVTRLGDIVRD